MDMHQPTDQNYTKRPSSYRQSHKQEMYGRRSDGLKKSDSQNMRSKAYQRNLDRATYDPDYDLKKYDKQRGKKPKYSLLQDNPKYQNYGRDGERYNSQVISPSTRLMMQSEKQFIEEYGNRRTKADTNASEESIWDKVSRMFTFGCIETNHNRR